MIPALPALRTFCRLAAPLLVLLGPASLAALVPAPAAAERLALVLANHDHAAQPDLPLSETVDRLADRLEDSGFVTLRLSGLQPGRAAARLDELAPRMRAADRLVIVLSGHLVAAGRETWLLGPQAGPVPALAIATAAMPLGPLLDVAGESPGRVLILRPEDRRQPVTGPGTVAADLPEPMPQGVTLLSGPPDALLEAVDRALAPGRPLAEAAQVPGLRAGGYLPRHAGFLDADLAEEPAADTPSDPVEALTPEERGARQEAALGLDRDDRRRVQRSLALLGHDPRGIDGVFGPGTRGAIRSWQASQGLDPSGYLGSRQLDLLRDAADRRAAELEREAAQRQAEADAADRDFWRDTGSGADETGLRAYLDRHPDGLFADVARDRLRDFEDARRARVPAAERADWDRAADADSLEAYQGYLDAYPAGAFAEDARQRIAALRDDAAERARAAALAEQERGVAGNVVLRRLVETRLADLGYEPGAVDGQFDAATRRALRRFQEARGLAPTGHVDQATMVRLLIGG